MSILEFFSTFLYSQFFVTPPYPTDDFSGKTVIVTGASAGLGLEAARHIARLQCAKLILAVRNEAKGQAAKESILASTKRTTDVIEVWVLDLSSNASVIAFAKRAEGLERLDAVIENAGVIKDVFQQAEGIEETIQVNVLATLLLALLLLPILRATEERWKITTHLAIVTSEVHGTTTVPEADADDIYRALNVADGYRGQSRYSVSKALEILFVQELATHLTAPSPVVTLVNPGLCYSELQRDRTSPVQKAFFALFLALLARTTEVGGRTLVAGVTAPGDALGKYMSDSHVHPVASWVRSPRGQRVQAKVFEQTMARLEEIVPGISGNIS